MAAFDNWADYYDLIHEGLPGDAMFYVGQAVRHGGPVLELGTGTGRIAILMAMSGIDVIGIDNSPAMLERCREKMHAIGPIKGSVALVCANMTQFELAARFPFIAMPYRAFMHLLTPEDQRRCLMTAHRHLEDNGVLILDSWAATPAAIVTILGAPEAEDLKCIGRYPLPGRNETLLHRCAISCDESHQRIIETHVIQEVDEHEKVRDEVRLPLVRVWTTPREMDNLVRLCGFNVVDVLGDFAGRPFTPESTEMIWVLKKA